MASRSEMRERAAELLEFADAFTAALDRGSQGARLREPESMVSMALRGVELAEMVVAEPEMPRLGSLPKLPQSIFNMERASYLPRTWTLHLGNFRLTLGRHTASMGTVSSTQQTNGGNR